MKPPPKKIIFSLHIAKIAAILAFILIPFISNAQPNSGVDCTCPFSDPSTLVITLDQTVNFKVPITTADNSIGSNPCNGSPPPTIPNACNISSSTTTQNQWQVSGGIGYATFGVSGSTGGSQVYTYGCSSQSTLNYWCQMCHAETGLREHTRTVTLTCHNRYGLVPIHACPAGATGSCTWIDGTYCDATAGSAPNCTASCPTPPG